MGGAIQGTPLVLTQLVSTFAGNSVNGSADGAGTAASFWNPVGITTTGTNLYVTDSGNNTIRRISITFNNVSTVAGSAGQSGLLDGTASAARFNNPQGITTDGRNLYVADSGNNTIRKIEIATEVVTTLAGSAGNAGLADGTGAAARFNNPKGITTDGANLYVADSGNNVIRKIEISTGSVTTIAGSAGGASGSSDGTGSTALFANPQGITMDGANLYITDSNNNTIRRMVIGTGVVTTLAGSAGNPGVVDGTGAFAKFTTPFGITTDGRNLYVTDDASTLRKIVLATGAVTTIDGRPGFFGAVDGTGNFKSLSTGGVGADPSLGGAGVPVLTFGDARFWFPEGVTTDGKNLYVSDTANNMIRKIN
jgi:sugar lactone lactonase YvrE